MHNSVNYVIKYNIFHVHLMWRKSGDPLSVDVYFDRTKLELVASFRYIWLINQ